MNPACDLLQKDTLVGDVLAACPQILAFFLEYRLDCMGCRMAGFCTLEEVCAHYSMEFDWLVTALTAIIQTAAQGSAAAHLKGES